MKNLIKKIPVIGPFARSVYKKWLKPSKPFQDSESYWVDRYKSGGNSGAGSYNRLADFKADVLNGYVAKNNIRSVIEFGCGDGNQLKLARYPSYVGFDVSPDIVATCGKIFETDTTKTFKLVKDYAGETAQLALSLDVIYHLIEDNVFEKYMETLFDSAQSYVIVYSSDKSDKQTSHVRHRNFTKWVAENRREWEMLEHVPNRYPYAGDNATGSLADFFIYGKMPSA
ncbi:MULTISPECIES: hypothetical protein [unclassified Rhodanobacter]|uniref:hypothetical protein n=1 Tax=unclassified Rhodanobacter TaxID=2621553 RepID=UPI00157C7AD4|nr:MULTISPECIES: hypothetical protein [unclassified Rhodanobacter]